MIISYGLSVYLFTQSQLQATSLLTEMVCDFYRKKIGFKGDWKYPLQTYLILESI